MKKFILILGLFLLLTNNCFATSILYRISSNEVIVIGEVSDFIGYDEDFFAVVDNPIFADGQNLLDLNSNGRVAGYAKVWDNGLVRNATQAEIDTFQMFADNDSSIAQVERAKKYFQNDPQFRRIMIAFVDILVAEFNRHKEVEDAMLQAAADATSLVDFQSRMVAIASVPERNLSDVKDAIKDRISEND